VKRFQLKNKIINDYKFYDVKGGGEARGGYRRRSLNRTREKKNPAGFGDDLQQVGEKWEYKMGVNPTDFDESLFNEYK